MYLGRVSVSVSVGGEGQLSQLIKKRPQGRFRFIG